MRDPKIIGPSSLPALALCAGRYQAERKARADGVIDKGSQAATDGTRRHAAVAWRLEHKSGDWPDTVRIEDDDLTGEQVLTIEDIAALDTVWPFYEKHPCLEGVLGRDYWVEQRVEVGRGIARLTGDLEWKHADLIYGTADFFSATDKVFNIVDNKFGRKPVIPDNWQNRAYAIGAGLKLDWFGYHQQIARGGKVRLTILQPTTTPWEKSIDFALEDMVLWAEKLKKIVEDAVNPDAERTPGETQCKYCLAAGTCSARLSSVSDKMFEVVHPESVSATTVPAETIPGDEISSPPPRPAPLEIMQEFSEKKASAAPEELTPEDLGRVLDLAPFLEGFIDAVRKEVYQRLERNDPDIERRSGWKLVRGNRKKTWVIPSDEIERKLRGIGLAVKEIYPKKMVTVAQADALVKSKSKKVQERFAKYWNWESGKPLLVPEGDERASLSMDMFDELDKVKAEPESKEKEPFTPEWI